MQKKNDWTTVFATDVPPLSIPSSQISEMATFTYRNTNFLNAKLQTETVEQSSFPRFLRQKCTLKKRIFFNAKLNKVAQFASQVMGIALLIASAELAARHLIA